MKNVRTNLRFATKLKVPSKPKVFGKYRFRGPVIYIYILSRFNICLKKQTYANFCVKSLTMTHHHHHHPPTHFNHLISSEVPILGDCNLEIDHLDHLSGHTLWLEPQSSPSVIVLLIIMVIMVMVMISSSSFSISIQASAHWRIGRRAWQGWFGYRPPAVKSTREPIMDFNCNARTPWNFLPHYFYKLTINISGQRAQESPY